MRVDIIRDLAQLKTLQPEWERLWSEDPDANVFASFEWFLIWWEHFGHGEQTAALVTHEGSEMVAVPGGDWQLRICVVRDESGQICAILPLVLVHGVFKSLRSRILASPVNSHAPRSGMVASSYGKNVISALCNALIELDGWDVLLLEGLQFERGQSHALVSGLRACKLIQGPQCIWPHSYFRFRGTWDDFLSGKQRNFRKHVWQNQRALEKLGEVRVESFTGTDRVPQGLGIFLAIDEASWKARDGESVGLNDALRNYYSALYRRLAARERAEIWVLHVGSEPAAAYLCLHDGRSRYTLKTSFSEAFSRSSRVSPSNVLLDLMIRQSWDMGTKGIDFVGKLPFVERWANEDRLFEQAVFYRGWTRVLRIQALEKFEQCTRRIKRIAERVGG